MQGFHKRRWQSIVGFASLVLACVAAPVGASADGTTVATGLVDPRFVAVTSDGTLYVTEAGTGGSEMLPPGPGGGPPGSRGMTGQVSKIAPDGTKTVIAKNLPSYNQEGAVGPAGIVVANGALWVSVGGGAVGANSQGAHLTPLPNESSLIKIDQQTGAVTQVADLGAYEQAHNPDGNNVDSNPYGVTLGADGSVYVDDAGGNVVYKVNPSNGQFTVAQVVNPLAIPAGVQVPPGGNPELGGKNLLDSVPASVAFGPDGNLYIGLLTGFPFPPGAAKVLKVGADGKQSDFATGLTMVTSIAFGPDGQLYASEISLDFSPTQQGKPPAPGNVVRIHADGTKDIVADKLMAPNGITFDAAGNLYVLNNTVTSGPPGTPPSGQVLKYAGVGAPTATTTAASASSGATPALAASQSGTLAGNSGGAYASYQLSSPSGGSVKLTLTYNPTMGSLGNGISLEAYQTGGQIGTANDPSGSGSVTLTLTAASGSPVLVKVGNYLPGVTINYTLTQS